MDFDENLQQYIYQYEGLTFAWVNEPDEKFTETVKMLSQNYHENFNKIIKFMLPDICEMYGDVSVEDVKNNLGKPIIDYDKRIVTYCEQTFDDCHIFEFEFVDDKFEDLQYFSIDG